MNAEVAMRIAKTTSGPMPSVKVLLKSSPTWKSRKPTAPAAGTVMTHATNILRATDHCTLARRPTPVPRIEPVATCVVESEYPKWLESRMTDADDMSADMPWRESRRTSPLPRVRMTRQPPVYVPSAIASAHEKMTHH